MTEINLIKVELNWCMDILKRVQTVLDNKDSTSEEKIQAVKWLVKQALKVERED